MDRMLVLLEIGAELVKVEFQMTCGGLRQLLYLVNYFDVIMLM
jgi:hypothetical protein